MGVVFCRTYGCILTCVGVAKLWSLTGDSTLLVERDPFLGIQFSHLMFLAATLELGVAAVCFFRPVVDGLLAIAWLSVLFVSYRAGLWWTGWTKPCSCLGILTDALHISPELADSVMKGLLAFMLIGSVSLLFMHWRAARLNRQAGDMVANGDQDVSAT
jgi:hypothetical protein